MRNLLSISDAPNRGHQAEGHRRAGSSRGKDAVGDQRAHVRVSRTLVRVPRHQACRNLSPRVFAARSTPEKRGLEGLADGDEAIRNGDTGEGRRVSQNSPPASTGEDARAYIYSRNGAVKSLAGNITAAHRSSNTPWTAIPISRKGRSNSHTIGYSTSASRASGQHNTNSRHHRRKVNMTGSPCLLV